MNRTIAKSAAATLMLGLSSVLPMAASAQAQPAEPPVAVKTDQLPAPIRNRLEEKARQGQTAVIQYLNRTRHMHQLRAEDVIVQQPDANIAAKREPEKARVADAREAKK